MLLGRFLEVSVPTTDVAASIAFYESLGFVQAVTGDVRDYPYAVVTDGRLFVGLHQAPITTATLTWVLPGLASHAATLQARGLDFEYATLEDGAFHELSFLDPAGQPVALLEARTFSPPALAPTHASELGYFEEFGIPTEDVRGTAAFWDGLGMVAFDPVRTPFRRITVAGRDLNIGVYDLELREPVLTFSAHDMATRIAALRERGYRFQERLPRGLSARDNALLRAPEGTQLLLLGERD
jgi:catechol 2,3-dioxygenase-like lactoylglutathione lyase family enzyme